MDRRLGEPLPHQQANPPRARPWSEAEATFSSRPEELLGHSVLIRVSPGYPDTMGGLPTCYSPVRRFPLAEARFSLDLHVLSAPPAFVLSQDQTLREGLGAGLRCWKTAAPADLSLRACMPSEEGSAQRSSRRTTRLMPCPEAARGRRRTRSRPFEERSLLSFQRPVPRHETAQKKPPTRARGLRGCESYQYESGLEAPWSSYRVFHAAQADGRRSIAPRPTLSTGRTCASPPAGARPRARRAAGRARPPAHRSP